MIDIDLTKDSLALVLPPFATVHNQNEALNLLKGPILNNLISWKTYILKLANISWSVFLCIEKGSSIFTPETSRSGRFPCWKKKHNWHDGVIVCLESPFVCETALQSFDFIENIAPPAHICIFYVPGMKGPPGHRVMGSSVCDCLSVHLSLRP